MIQATELGKRFGPHWVFQNVCFSVNRGQSLAILGPSGSGKSVLLKLIAGLLEPDRGSVQVQTSHLSMLFQKNALFDSLSVLENLLFPLREAKNVEGQPANEQAERLLRKVGLWDARELKPAEISGGMQKRLGIARALCIQPEVILYDEPTAGLDPITSRQIADLIRQTQKEQGTTLITVTNDVHRAYQLGDVISLLALGKLHSGGTPEQTAHSPNAALQQFIHGWQQGPLNPESEPA